MKARTIGIKILKNQLSEYIRLVKSGTRVLITDHDQVVAEIVQPNLESYSKVKLELIDEWRNSGKMLSPSTKKKKIEPSHLRLQTGTAQKLIDSDRGE
jgi:antitoxin (DNA-binding transcriptional repressor) of toxin-antitoxin stability system